MFLKEPIHIAPGVAKVGCQVLYRDHSVSLEEQIKGMIKEYILLLVSLKQMGQSALEKPDLLQGIIRVPDPLWSLAPHRPNTSSKLIIRLVISCMLSLNMW
jgi:hypothetical protein